ncbi:MAG: MgtC/SapB family protein [Thermodesulfobacteriota bacterium]
MTSMLTNLDPLLPSLMGRILLAAVLGGLIGIERDMHGRAAGLRTHLLVAAGAALFTILSELIPGQAALRPTASGLPAFADPARVASQIVVGIGFLGAGTIIKEGLTIRGLTTAACLWIVAAVGMAAGAGRPILAIATTALALLALVFLQYLERWYPKVSYRTLTLETAAEVEIPQVLAVLANLGLETVYVEIDRNYGRRETVLRLYLRLFHRGLTDRLAHRVITAMEKAGIPLQRLRWSR